MSNRWVEPQFQVPAHPLTSSAVNHDPVISLRISLSDMVKTLGATLDSNQGGRSLAAGEFSQIKC